MIPEFPIGEERADIVITANRSGGVVEPYAVIEVKKRVFTRPGLATAGAIKKARSYAQKLKSYIFYAVYDGWSLYVFEEFRSHLVIASGRITKESECNSLLRGLERYRNSNKLDLLHELPKIADPEFLLNRVFPSVVKVFENDRDKQERLLLEWKKLIAR